jgi:hypothetical protein
MSHGSDCPFGIQADDPHGGLQFCAKWRILRCAIAHRIVLQGSDPISELVNI